MEKHSYVEHIVHHDVLCAVVLRAQQVKDFGDSEIKTNFFTPDSFPFQLGLQNRFNGEQVAAHFHKPLLGIASLPVQEFLYVLSGKARVDLYNVQDRTKVGEVILATGDSIILNTGHEVTFLEDTKLLNLKQGPYRGRDEEKIFIDSR